MVKIPYFINILNIYPKANLQLLVCGLLSDMLLPIKGKRQKLQNLRGGWSSLLIIQGVLFYTSNAQISQKILLVSKFHNIDWIFKLSLARVYLVKVWLFY